jgi:hypothetical protein
LGEMYVVHFCNFDWLVKKAWMLLHPAHLTSITQNCTSFLNSPWNCNESPYECNSKSHDVGDFQEG